MNIEEEVMADNLDRLTEEFLKHNFPVNPNAKESCRECFGYGIGVMWFGSDGEIWAGKYGVCQECFPGIGDPQGMGLVSDHFLEIVLGEKSNVDRAVEPTNGTSQPHN